VSLGTSEAQLIGGTAEDTDQTRDDLPGAALIYLHATTERQRALADTLGALIESTMSERTSDQRPSDTDVARRAQSGDDTKKPRSADLG